MKEIPADTHQNVVNQRWHASQPVLPVYKRLRGQVKHVLHDSKTIYPSTNYVHVKYCPNRYGVELQSKMEYQTIPDISCSCSPSPYDESECPCSTAT